MPYVLTVDQIKSRDVEDLVAVALASLHEVETVLRFTRTVGDELQGLLDNPMSVVRAILTLMRTSAWHIGLGIGTVVTPLPEDTRSARGDAFVSARAAVEDAKQEVSHVSVVAPSHAKAEAADAQAVLRLMAALLQRRSSQGWQAVDLVDEGHTMAAAADRLQITRQAVGQRLQAAHWAAEQEAIPALSRLLSRAEALACQHAVAAESAGP